MDDMTHIRPHLAALLRERDRLITLAASLASDLMRVGLLDDTALRDFLAAVAMQQKSPAD